MKPNIRRVLLILLIAASLGIPSYIVYRMVPRAPKGQQSLVYFQAGMAPIFREDFNRVAEIKRIIVFLSPTDPSVAASARELEQLLQAHPDTRVKVFLIWQPTSTTDRRAPPNPILSLIPDRRVAQFHDPERVLTQMLKPSAAVLGYENGMRWEGSRPEPSFHGTIRELGEWLR